MWKPWNDLAQNKVPIIHPTGNNTGGPKVFGIVSEGYKAAPTIVTGGLTFAALVSQAATIAFVVTGLAAIVIGINALDGIKGKEIRKRLKKEIRDAEKEAKEAEI